MSFRKRFSDLSRSQSFKRLRQARTLQEPDVPQLVDKACEDSSSSDESLNQEVRPNILHEGEHSPETAATPLLEESNEHQLNVDTANNEDYAASGHDKNDFDHESDNSNNIALNDEGDSVHNANLLDSEESDNGNDDDFNDEGDTGNSSNSSDSEDGIDNDDDDLHNAGNNEHHADDDGDGDPDDDVDIGLLRDNEAEMQKKLALWILKNNISRDATAELLTIMRTSPHFQHLPRTRQALVHTSRESVVLQDMPPGKYYHFGLEQGLLDALFESYVDLAHGDTIQVIVNCDGVSLNKSNFEQFFTILGHAVALKGSSVFKIGIYHGNVKPQDAETFARPFVDECINIVNNGIDYEEKHFNVVIFGFVCDMPAQAFLLNTKGHTGFSSCTKCTVVGRSINRTTCFFDLNCDLRTDNSFRAKTDEDHHNGDTPITEIPNVDMVRSNPKEPFHLKYQGAMKKILTLMFGRKSPRKLPVVIRDAVSAEMKNVASFIPYEFQRRPRDLLLLDKYKGTELRLILLYTGPVVLSKILDGSDYNLDLYNNFLTIHVASVMLSKPAEEAEINYADQLLRHFVRGFKNIHGEQFVSQNIHSLIHVANDVRYFGPLENYSAFIFENENRMIRNVLKDSGEPLKQLVKRHEERRASGAIRKSSPPIIGFRLLQQSTNGLQIPDSCGPYYKAIEYAKFKLSVGKSNCCFMTDENNVYILESIAQRVTTNSPILIARKFVDKVDLYTIPRRSSSLKIFRVGNLGDRIGISPNSVRYKCLRIPAGDEEFAVFPMLHCFLYLEDAKKKAEHDGTYNYQGNLTSGDEDHTKRRKPTKFPDYETGSPEQSVLPKFPKSPGAAKFSYSDNKKQDTNKADSNTIVSSPGHIKQLFKESQMIDAKKSLGVAKETSASTAPNQSPRKNKKKQEMDKSPKKGRVMIAGELTSMPKPIASIPGSSQYVESVVQPNESDIFEDERPRSTHGNTAVGTTKRTYPTISKSASGILKIFDMESDEPCDAIKLYETESPRKIRGMSAAWLTSLPSPVASSSACGIVGISEEPSVESQQCENESPKKGRAKDAPKSYLMVKPTESSPASCGLLDTFEIDVENVSDSFETPDKGQVKPPAKNTYGMSRTSKSGEAQNIMKNLNWEPSGDGSNWSQAEFQRYMVKSVREMKRDITILKTDYVKRKSDIFSNEQSPSKKQKEYDLNEEHKKVNTLAEVKALDSDLEDEKKRAQWVKRTSNYLSSFVSDTSGASHAGRTVLNHIFSTSGKLATCYSGRAPGKFKLENSNIGKAIVGVMTKLGYRDPKVIAKVIKKPLYKANDLNTRHKKKSPKKKSPEKNTPESSTPEKSPTDLP